MSKVLWVILYLVLAPVIGGLLDGFDRKLSARMQGRKGPSPLQPFYDVFKLLNKQILYVNHGQTFLVVSYMVFVAFTGAMMYAGSDLLICFFALTTAAMFLMLAASCTHSPYSSIGSMRELLQMMSYEPMVLLTAIGFYLADGTFRVCEIIENPQPGIVVLPGFFVGFLFIITIKMRKSPFDLSTAHHAHQEVVKGITSELTGPVLAAVNIAEWYENVFLLSIVGLFFVTSNPASYIVAVIAALCAWFLEILIDNTSARVKWDKLLISAWAVTMVAGGLNLLILQIMR